MLSSIAARMYFLLSHYLVRRLYRGWAKRPLTWHRNQLSPHLPQFARNLPRSAPGERRGGVRPPAVNEKRQRNPSVSRATLPNVFQQGIPLSPCVHTQPHLGYSVSASRSNLVSPCHPCILNTHIVNYQGNNGYDVGYGKHHLRRYVQGAQLIGECIC